MPVADLIATSPLAGLLPLTTPGCTLTDATPDRLTIVAPLRGSGVAEVLREAGLDWPAPNCWVAGQGAAIFWAGREAAFLAGPVPEGLHGLAALTDQGDGWSVLRLTGPDQADVLARLVPLDLRPAAFAPQACARSLLGHMQVLVARHEDGATDLFVMRSMVRTAAHEIGAAMHLVAARAAGL